MRKFAIALSAVAALSTAAIATSPAEARGGRNAAIGLGLVAGAITAGAIANSYNSGYGYGGYRDSYAYYPGPSYGPSYGYTTYNRGYNGGDYGSIGPGGYTGGGQLPY